MDQHKMTLVDLDTGERSVRWGEVPELQRYLWERFASLNLGMSLGEMAEHIDQEGKFQVRIDPPRDLHMMPENYDTAHLGIQRDPWADRNKVE